MNTNGGVTVCPENWKGQGIRKMQREILKHIEKGDILMPAGAWSACSSLFVSRPGNDRLDYGQTVFGHSPCMQKVLSLVQLIRPGWYSFPIKCCRDLFIHAPAHVGPVLIYNPDMAHDRTQHAPLGDIKLFKKFKSV